MASISSLGIGSNIDLQSILTKIMAAESVPIKTLGTKITSINNKISVYGSLQSLLDKLGSAAETLEFPSKLSAISASSSDSKVLGATANSTATIGQYAIEVTALASAQKDVSSAYEKGTVFSAGSLTFTLSGDATTHDVAIAEGDTLSQVSAKINAADLGITATVISGTQGDRLILTGANSGAGNTFSFTSNGGVSPSTTGAGGTQLALESKDAALSVNAQDGAMTIDGISVSSTTNTFADAISGLTFTALSKGTSTVNVQNDGAKITSAVQTFVDAYNAVSSFIKTNTAYNATTKTGQALSGDSTARSIMSALNSARATVPTELSSATIKSLAELGVSIGQTGLMSLDTTKLNSAISASPDDVKTAINAYGKSFSETISSLVDSSGSVSTRVNSLNTLLRRTTDSQDALTVRVANIEKRYRAQFGTLDTLINSLTTTSGYLTQQFAALQSSSS